jgi:hypothetical protein
LLRSSSVVSSFSAFRQFLNTIEEIKVLSSGGGHDDHPSEIPIESHMKIISWRRLIVTTNSSCALASYAKNNNRKKKLAFLIWLFKSIHFCSHSLTVCVDSISIRDFFRFAIDIFLLLHFTSLEFPGRYFLMKFSHVCMSQLRGKSMQPSPVY